VGNRRSGLPSLLLLGLAVLLALAATLASAAESRSTAVLVEDRYGRLHWLDPLTLTELPTKLGPTGPRAGDLAGGAGTIWLASADGSTLVPLREAFGSSGTGIPAIVYDVATGRVRHRFAIDLPRQVMDGKLSADGRRLVVRGFNSDELDVVPPDDDSRSTWRVYDTTNGRQLETAEGPAPFPVPEFDWGPMQSWVIDAATLRVLATTTVDLYPPIMVIPA
jgi:hypothetical protein